MHLVITDSGLGGLSVCAKLVSLLKENSIPGNTKFPFEYLKITYINAAPSNTFGYNSIQNNSEKILMFKKFISNTKKIFNPNYIFVACGTLSVLLNELQHKENCSCKIEGIIPIGEKILLENLNQNPEANVIIFGTPTTISSKVFQNLLYDNGISKERIFTQSCPKLANKISNDKNGLKVSREIHNFVKKSLIKLPSNQKTPLIAFLACTHYAFRENFFYNSFKLEGQKDFRVLNPNISSAKNLRNLIWADLQPYKFKSMEISIEFVSTYSIPKREENTLSKLLYVTSPETVMALKNAKICTELI